MADPTPAPSSDVFLELTCTVTDPTDFAAWVSAHGGNVEGTPAATLMVALQSIVNGTIPGVECFRAAAGNVPGEFPHRAGLPRPIEGGESPDQELF